MRPRIGVSQISTLASYEACHEIRHAMIVEEEVGLLIGAPRGPQGYHEARKGGKNGQKWANCPPTEKYCNYKEICDMKLIFLTGWSDWMLVK